MKTKVAFYWCASCGGCEEAVLDLAEELLESSGGGGYRLLAGSAGFQGEGCGGDGGRLHRHRFINGAVRTTDQLKMARLLRRKSKLVVAFGVCAQAGGIPGLANLTDAQGVSTKFTDGTVTPQQEFRENGYRLTLPKLFDSVFRAGSRDPGGLLCPRCPPSPKDRRRCIPGPAWAIRCRRRARCWRLTMRCATSARAATRIPRN